MIEHHVPFSPKRITGLILIVQVCRTSSEGAVGWTPSILWSLIRSIFSLEAVGSNHHAVVDIRMNLGFFPFTTSNLALKWTRLWLHSSWLWRGLFSPLVLTLHLLTVFFSPLSSHLLRLTVPNYYSVFFPRRLFLHSPASTHKPSLLFSPTTCSLCTQETNYNPEENPLWTADLGHGFGDLSSVCITGSCQGHPWNKCLFGSSRAYSEMCKWGPLLLADEAIGQKEPVWHTNQAMKSYTQQPLQSLLVFRKPPGGLTIDFL